MVGRRTEAWLKQKLFFVFSFMKMLKPKAQTKNEDRFKRQLKMY